MNAAHPLLKPLEPLYDKIMMTVGDLAVTGRKERLSWVEKKREKKRLEKRKRQYLEHCMLITQYIVNIN